VCRRYQVAQQRTHEREVLIARLTTRRGRKVICLDDLVELPPFESSIATVVTKDKAVGEDVSPNVISIITPLSNYATTC